MNVLIDLLTGNVTGYARPAEPNERELLVPDSFTLSKLVERWVDRPVMETRTEIREIPVYDEVTGEPTGEIRTMEEQVTEPTGEMELVPVQVTVQFASEYDQFTEADIVAEKKRLLEQSSVYKVAHYDEQLAPGAFSALQDALADFGAGFVAVHPGSFVRTEKLTVPATTVVRVHVEGSEKLAISVGATASTLNPVVNGVAIFDEPVTSVYVKFHNPTASRQMLHAFGLLV